MIWWTIRKLSSSDSRTRRAAVEELATSGSRKAVEPLLRVCRTDPERGIQIEAANALATLGDQRAIDVLASALESSHVTLRRAAAAALEKLSWKPTEAHQRARFLVELGKYQEAAKEGTSAVAPLMRALTEADRYPQEFKLNPCFQVPDALVTIGSPAVDALIAGLSQPKVATWAAGALGKIRDARAVQPLIEVLKKDKYARERSIEALGAIGGAQAAEALAVAMSDPDINVKKAAAVALAKVGTVPEPFIKALASSDYVVRTQAVAALAKLQWKPSNTEERIAYAIARREFTVAAAEGSVAVEALAAALGEGGYEALNALSTIRDPRIVQIMIQVIKGRTYKVWLAVKILREILRSHSELASDADLVALSLLDNVEQMKAGNLAWNAKNSFEPIDCSVVRYLARRELSKRRLPLAGSDDDLPKKLAKYTHVLRETRDWSEGGSTAMALGMIGDESAVPLLLEALASNNIQASKGQVMRGLAALGDVRAVAPLLDVITKKPCSDANRAVEALAQLVHDTLRKIETAHLERLVATEEVVGSDLDDDFKSYTYQVSVEHVKRLASEELKRRQTA
jgi:HEAT repeat protein